MKTLKSMVALPHYFCFDLFPGGTESFSFRPDFIVIPNNIEGYADKVSMRKVSVAELWKLNIDSCTALSLSLSVYLHPH